MYSNDLSEPKYDFLIKKPEHLNDSNAFIECSNTIDAVYENIDDYNSTRKRKSLIAFE